MEGQNVNQVSSSQKPGQNNCFHQPDEYPIDIHSALCCRQLLIIFRIVAIIGLILRVYLNISKTYESLFEAIQFLTHFGFILTLLYYFLTLEDYILNVVVQNKTPKYQFHKNRLKYIIVVLYQIALCIQVPIVILYWSVVNQRADESAWQITKDVGNHGLPLFFLLTQLTINQMPFVFKHLKYVLAASIIYLLINMTYSVAVEPVYKPLTWKTWRSYALVVGALFMVSIVHLLCLLLWRKCKMPRVKVEPQASTTASNNFHESVTNL